ncbi:MAG: ATP-binding cassette domain-containing protein [Oscillospiraceae bacterium]|jgi:oligopeptide/dipeptide ABC transporter ATP-binding protein|nr:ATP-binding cassette domain-containing protein [Oscillospiraceae bacterium]
MSMSDMGNANSQVRSGEPLYEVRNLTKVFATRSSAIGGKPLIVRAVNDVTFDIKHGEVLGLVGESGCGKTTTGRLLIRLLDPTSGSIVYGGQDIAAISPRQMRALRKDMQIIFQDPFSSLNPRMTCMDIIAEPLILHTKMSRVERREKAYELLRYVGLPREYALRFPHEFSGGQRQRIGIARALSIDPKFIVCDEPVSALDVSVQSQVLNLIQKLRQDRQLTLLFIAHGLNVVKYISDRVGVMYLGSLLELADSDAIYAKPLHPYTQSLISAIPDVDGMGGRGRALLQGEIPSPTNMPSGCPFHTRCSRKQELCESEKPKLREVEAGHSVACHLV